MSLPDGALLCVFFILGHELCVEFAFSSLFWYFVREYCRKHKIMTSITLDDYDHAILSALIADSAQTSAQLSELVHLSASQCARRKARLEEAGVIAGYSARTNDAALGYHLRAITRVNLAQHNEESANNFARFLELTSEIEAAWSVSGDADYVLNVKTRDLASFAAFIHQRLLPHPNLTQVRSEIVLVTLK